MKWWERGGGQEDRRGGFYSTTVDCDRAMVEVGRATIGMAKLTMQMIERRRERGRGKKGYEARGEKNVREEVREREEEGEREGCEEGEEEWLGREQRGEGKEGGNRSSKSGKKGRRSCRAMIELHLWRRGGGNIMEITVVFYQG